MCSTLRVTDVGKLTLASFLEYEINESGCVVFSHVDVVEFPELLLTLVFSFMSLRKPISSVVSKPNVVALVNKNKWRSKVGIVCDPKVHVAQKTMHHKHGRLLHRSSFLLQSSWNTIYLTDIAVRSSY